MSMFTGLHHAVHGVNNKEDSLSPTVKTVTEILKDAGYRTIGLMSNIWLKAEFGFDRGFDHYEQLGQRLTYSDRLPVRLFELLDDRDDPQLPLFLFLHLYDPHSDFSNAGGNQLPYYAPPEFLADTGYDKGSTRFCLGDGRCATDFLMAMNREPERLDEATLDELKLLYQKGVEYLDHDLAVLFDGLEDRGLWHDSLVIVTSDHGEEFMEHGELIHNQPYVENLAIPLFMKMPRGRFSSTRCSHLVEVADFLPTILDVAGLAAPRTTRGQSLVKLVEGSEAPREFVAGQSKLKKSIFTLRSKDYTLVFDARSENPELYDRAQDPSELADVGSGRMETVDRMVAVLRAVIEENRQRAAWIGATAVEGPSILDEEEQELLRAIGYGSD